MHKPDQVQGDAMTDATDRARDLLAAAAHEPSSCPEPFSFHAEHVCPHAELIEQALATLAVAITLAQALEDLVPLAVAAMREANNDGAEYDYDGELNDARKALAAWEGLFKKEESDNV